MGFKSTKKQKQNYQFHKNLDERTTRELLLKHFDHFKEVVIKDAIDGEVGAEYIIDELNKQLTNVYKQLSIFDV